MAKWRTVSPPVFSPPSSACGGAELMSQPKERVNEWIYIFGRRISFSGFRHEW